jgi:lysyl endopeptidase
MKKCFFLITVVWLFLSAGLKSQSCYISADDPVASGYTNEKKAVAKILFPKLVNGETVWTATGTGVLIMNTCGTNTPYLLTAYHVLHPCGSHSNDLSPESLKFQFQYSGLEIIGATEVAKSVTSDFSLLKLSTTPPVNSGVYYSGWDNRVNSVSLPIVILHHPNGNSMSYSADNSNYQTTSYGDCGAECWHIILNIGATAGGSSGAPYFSNHRIIGQHNGFYDSENCSLNIGGGKFSLSWTNSSQLRTALDPLNLNIGYTNTTSIENLLPDPSTVSISGPSTACPGATYSLGNLPTGTIVNWSCLPAGNYTLNPNGSQCTISSTSFSGQATLSASVTYPCSVFTFQKSILLTYAPNYYTLYAQLTTGGTTDWLKDYNCLLTYTFPGMYSGDVNILDPQGLPVITNATWTKISQTGCSFANLGPSSDGKHLFLNFKPSGCTAVIRLTASNSCGNFTHDFTFRAGSSPFCSVLEAITGSGANQNELAPIAVYPNPTSGEFSIDYGSIDNNGGIKELVITNNLGTIILKKTYNSQKSITLNLSNYNPGIYYIEIFDGKERICRQLSIKK